MANTDSSVIIENLTELLKNTVNMTSVFYDIFLNPEEMDVELQQYNAEGDIEVITIPNRAKDRKIALSGNGSPEGVIEANVGTCYVDESNSAVYFKAQGTGDTGWVEASNENSVEEYVRTYLANNNYATKSDINTYLVNNNYMTESQVDNKFLQYNPTIPVTVLNNVSGIQALADNTAYAITISGSVTFSLPTPTNMNILHKIFIQLNNPQDYYNVTLSQSLSQLAYFDKIIPSFSSGMYNIIYEYDNASHKWVVGAMAKGVPV